MYLGKYIQRHACETCWDIEMRESVAIQSTDLCPNLNGHNGDSDDPTHVIPLRIPPNPKGLLMSRAIKTKNVHLCVCPLLKWARAFNAQR